jgi:hypothetical protein
LKPFLLLCILPFSSASLGTSSFSSIVFCDSPLLWPSLL